MKTCNKCGETKPLSEFNVMRHAPDGRRYSCNACASKASRAWNIANKARSNATCLRYKKRKPHMHKVWVAANREHCNQYMREWRKTHSITTPYAASEKYRKVTPKWANRFFLKEAYRLARLRTKMLGVAWEVDHIIPLNHPLVCGLHVETNIRVIPRFANRSRGNRGWLKEATT